MPENKPTPESRARGAKQQARKDATAKRASDSQPGKGVGGSDEFLRRAEASALPATQPDVSVLSGETGRLRHELSVHQAELLAQNEELRDSQEKLARARDRLARIFAHSPMGYLVLGMDGSILEASHRGQEILAFPKGPVGRRLADFILVQDRPALDEALVDAASTGVRQVRELRYVPHRSPGPRYLRLTLSSLRPEEDEGVLILAMAEDVTEAHHDKQRLLAAKRAVEDEVNRRTADLVESNSRLRQEIGGRKAAESGLTEALAESGEREKQLSALFRAAQVVLTMEEFPLAARAIFDATSGLVGSTAGYVALLSADGSENELLFLEAGGRPCSVNPELPMPIRGLRAEAYRDNAVVYDNDFMHSRWMAFMPRGHVRLDNVLFAPLVLQGKTLGIMGLANKPGGFTPEDAVLAKAFADLAAIALKNSRLLNRLVEGEQKQRELADAARFASQAKSDFLANMSHELRTPLNGIMGMLQLLGGLPLSGEQRQYVDTALQSSRSMLSLVNDLLDLSRIEAGRMSILVEPVDLQSVLESVRNILEPVARSKGIHLRATICPGAPRAVQGDPVRLRQVLLNLAGNAVKFTESGEVHMEISTLPSPKGCGSPRLYFSVADTGPGMDEDVLARIFQPFVQGDGTTQRRHGGAGLGLAISRKLLQLMGSNLAVDTMPGRGSEFAFTLPLLLAEPVSSAPAPVEATEQKRSMRLLLAEDDPVNRLVAKRMLERLGHEVTCACDGGEAVEALLKGGFDCALLDISMPVLDGSEVLERVRYAQPENACSRIPAIAMTAHAMQGDRERFMASGFDGYIPKPVEIDELARALASLALDRDRRPL